MRNDIRVKRRRAAPPVPSPLVTRAPSAPEPKAAQKRATARPKPVKPLPIPPEYVSGDLYVTQEEPRRAGIPWRYLKRGVIAVFAVAALVGLGFKVEAQTQQTQNSIASQVAIAQQALQGARQSLSSGDYPAAKGQFDIAAQALHQANVRIANEGQAGMLPSSQATGSLGAAKQLLRNAELLARSGSNLSGDISAIQDEFTRSGGDFYKSGEVLVGHLPAVRAHLAEVRQQLTLLSYTIADAKRSPLSGDLKKAVDTLSESLPAMREGSDRAQQIADGLPKLLGADHLKHYLVWFQNPAEIRATGGFIGTYGRIKLDNGALKELNVDSIYNPANQVNQVIKEPAPTPYKRFYGDGREPTWGLQDTNWSPNLPESAKRFQKFYEKSGGPTTDGVIALTTVPVVSILQLLGPIEMPEYGYVLSAENFQALIQADQLERSVEGDADPKRILRDFLPKMMERINQANPEQRKELAKIWLRAAASHDFQVFFTDAELDEVTRSLKIDGELEHSTASLGIFDTNIAGHKSSADIQSVYRQNVTIDDTGQTIVDLEITRRHSAATSQATNSNYTRVFLPAGTEVLESTGYETPEVTVDQQDGDTVIGGWTTVAPSAESTARIRYRLPKGVPLSDGVYPILVRKQAGMVPDLHLSVTLPAGYTWENRESFVVDGARIQYDGKLDKDITGGLRFKKT